MTIPANHIVDAQQSLGDAYVDLYQVDLYGGSTVYLCQDNTVSWNGNNWEGIGLQLEGEGSYGDEQVSRPKLTLQNAASILSPFMSQRAFDCAIVTRFRVLRNDLIQNLPIYTSQVWQVGRIVGGNRFAIVAELRGFADAPNFIIPAQTFSPPRYPLVSL